MGARIRTVAVVLVVLAVGTFLGSMLSQWWAAPDARAGGVLPVRVPRERVRVEVLNGAGKEGLARSATDLLRDDGFDVVYYGNAVDFGNESSVIVDRVGRVELARSVADALGVRRVRSEPDSNLYLDVTVVLGEDWAPPAPAPADTVTGPPWWDFRRWILKEGDQPSGPLADPPSPGG